MDKQVDFDKAFDENFTIGNVLTIKAIETIIETGKYEKGSYDTLVVLSDGAGITWGKNQTTENSGGIYKVLKYYLEDPKLLDNMYGEQLKPYMDKLYDGKDRSKKFALSKDSKFQELLVEATQRDRKMREAQRKHFHNNYFRPMYELALDYDITLPLGLMVFYDMGIHSGPRFATQLIDKFDKEWTSPAKFDIDKDGEIDDKEFTDEEWLELERAWINGLIEFRLNWLLNFKSSRRPKHTKVVRLSSYRMYAMQHYAEQGDWDLELPLTHKNIHKYNRSRPYVSSTKLTEELIREVELM